MKSEKVVRYVPIMGFLVMISLFVQLSPVRAGDQDVPKAHIDGTGPHWQALDKDDFIGVNGREDTWQFNDGLIKSTGEPIGVIRTKKKYTNFEVVVEWRFLESGGNSGMFAWAPMKALKDLEPGNLPDYGIEIQMLDPGFRKKYQERTGKKGEWFSTHGDVFPVGESKLTPFKPTSPNGSRSFPTEDRTKTAGNWNHYYVRFINGEVRLWVNGKEVSGGKGAEPSTGHLCLESEGTPIEFRNLRIRELP